MALRQSLWVRHNPAWLRTTESIKWSAISSKGWIAISWPYCAAAMAWLTRFKALWCCRLATLLSCSREELVSWGGRWRLSSTSFSCNSSSASSSVMASGLSSPCSTSIYTSLTPRLRNVRMVLLSLTRPSRSCWCKVMPSWAILLTYIPGFKSVTNIFFSMCVISVSKSSIDELWGYDDLD